MLKDLKNTIRQSAVYGFSRVAVKAVSFILIPLYTSIFTTQSIANVNLLESLWQYIFIICLFALETAMITFCMAEKDPAKIKRLLFIFFSIALINAALFIVIGYFISPAIAQHVLKDNTLSDVTFYCFLISSAETLLTLPLTIARLNNRAGIYTFITVFSLLINLGLQIYFLSVLKLGFVFIFVAKFVAPGVLVVITLYYVIKNISPYFSKPALMEILKFSLPLMLASLVAIMLNTVDRYILTDYVSKDKIAVYTIGYSIGSLTNFFIVTPFMLAFNVMSWKKLDEPNGARFFTKSATYLYFLMIFVSLIISFFIPYLIKIFIRNPQLWESVNIIWIILFSNCIASLFFISIQSFYFKKKSHLILFVTLVSLIFNLAANFLFARYAGIYAAAVNSVLSYLLLILLSYNVAKKLYYIKFEIFKLILLSFVYLIFSFIVIYFNSLGMALDIILKCVLLILFPYIIYLFGFFEPIERERIYGFFNKYVFKYLKIT